MRTLLAFLTLSAFGASGADFRALDIGQPCASAPAWEIAHGSTPLPWNTVQGGENYAFKSREFDREIVVMYFCVHESLFTGNYYFPIESLDQAVEGYRNIHSRLRSSYGETFLDSSPWNGYGDNRSVAPDPRHYMTTWRTSRVSATLALMPNHPSESAGFRVFVVIGAPQK